MRKNEKTDENGKGYFAIFGDIASFFVWSIWEKSLICRGVMAIGTPAIFA